MLPFTLSAALLRPIAWGIGIIGLIGILAYAQHDVKKSL